jgi:hypothetical protein
MLRAFIFATLLLTILSHCMGYTAWIDKMTKGYKQGKIWKEAVPGATAERTTKILSI